MTIYDLAELLHSKQCRSEHTEHCGWYYEDMRENKWEGWAHKSWLDKAYRIEADIDMPITDIAKVLRVL